MAPSGGGHWTVVIGYDSTGFWMNDPYGSCDLVGGGYPGGANPNDTLGKRSTIPTKTGCLAGCPAAARVVAAPVALAASQLAPLRFDFLRDGLAANAGLLALPPTTSSPNPVRQHSVFLLVWPSSRLAVGVAEPSRCESVGRSVGSDGHRAA